MPAAIGSKYFDSLKGLVWIQPSGPNTPFLFTACWRITGSPTIPEGDITVLRCPSPVVSGATVIVGQSRGTPGNPTMQITAPLDLVNYLLSIRCDWNFQNRWTECGTPQDPTGWEQLLHIKNAAITSRSIEGLDHGAMDAKASNPIEVIADITFETVTFINKPVFVAVTVTAISGAHLVDVAICDSPSCPGVCGVGSPGCEVGWVISAGAGSVEQLHKTEDGGSTWTHQDSPFVSPYDELVSIDCAGDLVIVASGVTAGTIARSTDGGATWAIVDTGVPTALNDVFVLDAANVWVCGDGGYIAYSSNGGSTWVIQDAGVVTAANLNEIAFWNTSVGFAVGVGGAIVRTLDGATWGAVTSGTANALKCVAAVSEFIWFAGGVAGTLIYTGDRGTTWTARAGVFAATDIVNGLSFCDQIGVAVGTTQGGAGIMKMTIDGGYTWQAVTIPATTGLNAVECCIPNMTTLKVFAAAQSGIVVMNTV